MRVYHIIVFCSEEDGCHVADIPEHRHSSAISDTLEEALHEVLFAKAAWLEAAQESCRSDPEPRYHPMIYQVAG
jgi:predicted RNase H-like HicB family nuclease